MLMFITFIIKVEMLLLQLLTLINKKDGLFGR